MRLNFGKMQKFSQFSKVVVVLKKVKKIRGNLHCVPIVRQGDIETGQLVQANRCKQ